MAAQVYSTPVNTITREALTVLITNNVMNSSPELSSDCEMMETDSPVRKPNIFPISKKLFHSPMNENYPESTDKSEQMKTHLISSHKSRRSKKRKQALHPDSADKMKKVYIIERDRDGYSPCGSEGMRRKVLISLFHNKEYTMELSNEL